MRLIRFKDKSGQCHFGCDYQDGGAFLVNGTLEEGMEKTGERRQVSALLSPVIPTAILCIGLNYRKHAQETGMALPDFPILFMKNPAAINHPGEAIILPECCMDPPQVDFEAELAVVIGRKAKDVSPENALDYVFGYTAGNDVSARRWQKKGGGGQWVKGKSFDTFCPLGPELVTADEIKDPQKLSLRCFLNGMLMQDSLTADMIFSVAELISFLSMGTTLLPGTVILTGTPSGVGFARNPPVFLSPGDTVEVEIDGIGRLVNQVASAASLSL